MRTKVIFISLLCAYLAVIVPFSGYMKNRPIAVKLGYTPNATLLKIASGDHRLAVAQAAVVKVLFYFGTLVEKSEQKIKLKPEYHNMYETLVTAVKLDPYNMDAYYFAQAAFTWEVGRVKEVNRMLDYGMRYRTWDSSLPFYAGFNAAFFLQDYKNAALYMKKAAEISGDPLYTTLTARYFYESDQNELGILFLESMQQGAKDKSIRQVFQIRKEALVAIRNLSAAVQTFTTQYKRMPKDLDEMVTRGVIPAIPVDPYGGRFYIDESGKIRSTSKFAFGSETGDSTGNKRAK